MNCAVPECAATPIPFLVIGYGNELRGDDALGPRTATALAGLRLPGVESIACHQLVPELAALLARAKAVVFVDASVDATRDMQLVPVAPEDAPLATGHFGSPAALLGLARLVYGVAPEAWWMTLPAHDLDYGTELSATARHLLDQALDKLAALAAHRTCTKPAS